MRPAHNRDLQFYKSCHYMEIYTFRDTNANFSPKYAMRAAAHAYSNTMHIKINIALSV